ncbi:MAG: hypothetical protein JXA81_05715 [Sedimentisphaerales bacterium]|nr:hypothetical protein [Sedimentisphaerales bacterium]
MKAVLIIHNVAIEQDVNEALESMSIDCYTKFPNILGKGRASEPHLNTDVWPGINCGTFVVTEDAPAKELMEKVCLMREKWASEGIKAFMWKIEDITP